MSEWGRALQGVVSVKTQAKRQQILNGLCLRYLRDGLDCGWTARISYVIWLVYVSVSYGIKSWSSQHTSRKVRLTSNFIRLQRYSVRVTAILQCQKHLFSNENGFHNMMVYMQAGSQRFEVHQNNDIVTYLWKLWSS